jgi:uncharacterized protein
MFAAVDETLPIALPGGETVSALLTPASAPRACCVLAHGAGAGMRHPFMAAVAQGLAARGITVLRYQFSWMERGSRRPDPPRIAHAPVRAAVAEAARRFPGLPLIAGGKSFGGRMTSQAQAAEPLPGVAGIVFFGFPLHARGKPGDERAAHLAEVKVPMLFLQGERDELARLDLLRLVITRLGARATLHVVAGGDHSFRVPAASGRKGAEVMAEVLDAVAGWGPT